MIQSAAGDTTALNACIHEERLFDLAREHTNLRSRTCHECVLFSIILSSLASDISPYKVIFIRKYTLKRRVVQAAKPEVATAGAPQEANDDIEKNMSPIDNDDADDANPTTHDSEKTNDADHNEAVAGITSLTKHS